MRILLKKITKPIGGAGRGLRESGGLKPPLNGGWGVFKARSICQGAIAHCQIYQLPALSFLADGFFPDPK